MRRGKQPDSFSGRLSEEEDVQVDQQEVTCSNLPTCL